MLACVNGHRSVVKVLALADADVDAQNAEGQTALHFCFAYGHGDSLGQWLRDRGADFMIQNREGRTCAEVRSTVANPSICASPRAHGEAEEQYDQSVGHWLKQDDAREVKPDPDAEKREQAQARRERKAQAAATVRKLEELAKLYDKAANHIAFIEADRELVNLQELNAVQEARKVAQRARVVAASKKRADVLKDAVNARDAAAVLMWLDECVPVFPLELSTGTNMKLSSFQLEPMMEGNQNGIEYISDAQADIEASLLVPLLQWSCEEGEPELIKAFVGKEASSAAREHRTLWVGKHKEDKRIRRRQRQKKMDAASPPKEKENTKKDSVPNHESHLAHLQGRALRLIGALTPTRAFASQVESVRTILPLLVHAIQEKPGAFGTEGLTHRHAKRSMLHLCNDLFVEAAAGGVARTVKTLLPLILPPAHCKAFAAAAKSHEEDAKQSDGAGLPKAAGCIKVLELLQRSGRVKEVTIDGVIENAATAGDVILARLLNASRNQSKRYEL
jgi:hypothetical protein